METKQTPLIDLLERVPQDARCRVDEPDGMGSVFIRVGRLCHEAASALRAALAEPQEPSEMVLVPRELLERASESLGAFISDHGWAQADMDVMDDIDWTLAASCAHPALQRQPLTDEAILAMVKTAPALDTAEAEWLQVARAIEKAHGIGGQDE